jgi:16S rRNA U1498 N3-methylase RsmE
MYGEIADIVEPQRIDTIMLEDGGFASPSSVEEVEELQENNNIVLLKTTIEAESAHDIVEKLTEAGYSSISKQQSQSGITVSF